MCSTSSGVVSNSSKKSCMVTVEFRIFVVSTGLKNCTRINTRCSCRKTSTVRVFAVWPGLYLVSEATRLLLARCGMTGPTILGVLVPRSGGGGDRERGCGRCLRTVQFLGFFLLCSLACSSGACLGGWWGFGLLLLLSNRQNWCVVVCHFSLWWQRLVLSSFSEWWFRSVLVCQSISYSRNIKTHSRLYESDRNCFINWFLLLIL